MSSLQHMKRHRANLGACAGLDRTDLGPGAHGKSWISHTAPGPSCEGTQTLTLSLFIRSWRNVRDTWGIEIHSSKVTEYAQRPWCVCGREHHNFVDHTAGDFIHPQETPSTSTQYFLSGRPAWCHSVRWLCVPVQIDAVIKQLRAERQGRQEQAVLTHPTKYKFGFTREYKHMLDTFDIVSSSWCAGEMKIYLDFHCNSKINILNTYNRNLVLKTKLYIF